MKEQYFTSLNLLEKAEEIKAGIRESSDRKRFLLNPAESVLLVLDMQNYFLSESSPAFIPSAKAILPIVEKWINFAEQNNIPVIYTRHINNEDDAGMMGKWWSRLLRREDKLSELIFQNASPVIVKSQYDAFYHTNLEELTGNKAQIVICGVMTHLCCETTLRSAFVKGYEVVMPIDATATYNLELHQATFNLLSHGFCPPVLTNELLDPLI